MTYDNGEQIKIDDLIRVKYLSGNSNVFRVTAVSPKLKGIDMAWNTLAALCHICDNGINRRHEVFITKLGRYNPDEYK